MADDARRSLAEAFAAWMLLRGVTVADVQRASGVARHTIENVRDGGHRIPQRATLRKIAIGLVTEPSRSVRYDAATMTECYRDLSLAAGYGDPSASETLSLLDLAVFYHFRSPAKAHVWAELMRRYRDVEPERLWELFRSLEPGSSAPLAIE